jgi:uncharacterized damage-inducible protein DinB
MSTTSTHGPAPFADALRSEFGHEAGTARRQLERLPEDRLTWRPHPKSFTAGMLGSHLVECLGWIDPVFAADHFDMDPAAYWSFNAASTAGLLDAFDRRVAACKERLSDVTDADLLRTWRFSLMGKVRREIPRIQAYHGFVLHHLIHHRGQLTVYLRLLDIPVPGSYGPTADDQA